MQTDRLETEIKRGQRAKEILDSDLFNEAWTTLRDSYVAAWSSSTTAQAVEREKLYLAIGILAAVRRSFEHVLNTGYVADHELSAQNAERTAANLTTVANHRGF